MSSLLVLKNTLIIQVGLFLCFAVWLYRHMHTENFLLVISAPQVDGRGLFNYTQEKYFVLNHVEMLFCFFLFYIEVQYSKLLMGYFLFNRQCCYVLTLQYCSKVDPGEKKIT